MAMLAQGPSAASPLRRSMPAAHRAAFARAPKRPVRRTALCPRAIAPQELGRLMVNVVTTGLALREHGLQNLPPSQLIAGTVATAGGAAYSLAGLPHAVDPTLVAASVYACYRAWHTHATPPHVVAPRPPLAGADPSATLAEGIMLAALADGAARFGTLAGAGAYAAALGAAVPALWAAARAGGEAGTKLPAPVVRVLATKSARVAIGLVGTLAATAAAERMGGAPAAVGMSLWASARMFPQGADLR